ncbi:NAD(P)H-binding protein [Actinophytocola oryzae]|uniref:Putative NADH-flavin reductase n=1 Tax=Actinophytocola oryzae TaxID=502181 RepID=A0A4R7VP21_9PSEU|nr:NAD(P)H-binding protein [Actinophytocola oryzae]TDV51108.1 putative NADH-flavin reductase [Actinophytocola oryzae]
MVVTVLGASGRTGRHLVRSLVRQGHSVRAGVRNGRRREAVAGLGATPVVADLCVDPDELVDAFTGSDVVINVAGAADPDPAAVALVDRDGAIAGVRAAERAAVRRYIQLSAQFADAPDQGDRLVRSILYAKQISDNVLVRSSLVWTVVRAGTLTDEPATNRVSVAGHLGAGRVSRQDVAAVLSACLREPRTENRGFDVHTGPLPVAAALAALD